MTELKRSENRTSPIRTSDPVRSLTAEEILTLEPPSNSGEEQTLLQELTVTGLLSFGDETTFQFGRLNILVGPNGSGKSNLIDCLRLLHNAPYDIQETFKDAGFEQWLYKGKNNQPTSTSASLIATLHILGLPHRIYHQINFGQSFNSRAPLEELIRSSDGTAFFTGSHRRNLATVSVAGTGQRRRNRPMNASEYDSFKSIVSQLRDMRQYPEITRLSDVYAGFRIYSEWTFGRSSILREATPTGNSATSLSQDMSNLALILNGLERTSAHERIRELLQELKETYVDYTTRIFFGRVGLELVEKPFELPLSATRLSDGTLRFLALAAILLQPDPSPLICLEEPELGMHPDMIRLVASMIIDASAKTQVIITTHSEHLLSALQDDFDALFAFGTGVAGSLVRRFSQQDYEFWRQENTLGELWTSGELGGNRW